MSRSPARIEVRLQRLEEDSRAGARRVLFDLLAARTGGAAAGIRVIRDDGGKPRLADSALEFSFSYRDRWCAVAFSKDCPVGVDVEVIRPIAAMEDVVEQFFPAIAKAGFAAAAAEERLTVFFQWWTRIEAAVKATGAGLSGMETCFEGVVWASCETAPPGLTLAVAARTAKPLETAWML